MIAHTSSGPALLPAVWRPEPSVGDSPRIAWPLAYINPAVKNEAMYVNPRWRTNMVVYVTTDAFGTVNSFEGGLSPHNSAK